MESPSKYLATICFPGIKSSYKLPLKFNTSYGILYTAKAILNHDFAMKHTQQSMTPGMVFQRTIRDTVGCIRDGSSTVFPDVHVVCPASCRYA